MDLGVRWGRKERCCLFVDVAKANWSACSSHVIQKSDPGAVSVMSPETFHNSLSSFQTTRSHWSSVTLRARTTYVQVRDVIISHRKITSFLIALYPEKFGKISDIVGSSLFTLLLYDTVSSTEVTYREPNWIDYESSEKGLGERGSVRIRHSLWTTEENHKYAYSENRMHESKLTLGICRLITYDEHHYYCCYFCCCCCCCCWLFSCCQAH
jgi:hypothetical protein